MDSPQANHNADRELFVFPRWFNSVRVAVAVLVLGGGAYAVLLLALGAAPAATDVGYQPVQPVPYSHALHAGRLGLDCRYCHTTVETASHAALPPSATCMNCHATIRQDSLKLLIVRESHRTTGKPVEWVRVHDLPDYVYFNHSAHVSRGVGCRSCHGRIDQMEVVYQDQPLSMGWCLDCHRDPAAHLRPVDRVTDIEYEAEDQRAVGEAMIEQLQIDPPTDCSTCHR